MKKSHERLVNKAFMRLGSTSAEASRLVRLTRHLMDTGIRDYVNQAAKNNHENLRELFRKTPPQIKLADPDEKVADQFFAKSENFSNIRVINSARECMFTTLDKVLEGFHFSELIIGGAKFRTLTPESDVDIPVVTSCRDLDRVYLATVTCNVALSEKFHEIPCGSCTQVYNEEQVLTASSIGQHFVKTAILASEPIFDQAAFFEGFQQKGYDKLRKLGGDEETIDGMYSSELETYSVKTRKKIGNALEVKPKELLKATQIELSRLEVETRGLNALRASKFSELYSKFTKKHPVIADVGQIIGSILRQANGHPDIAIPAYKMEGKISKMLDIFESLNRS